MSGVEDVSPCLARRGAARLPTLSVSASLTAEVWPPVPMLTARSPSLPQHSSHGAASITLHGDHGHQPEHLPHRGHWPPSLSDSKIMTLTPHPRKTLRTHSSPCGPGTMVTLIRPVTGFLSRHGGGRNRGQVLSLLLSIWLKLSILSGTSGEILLEPNFKPFWILNYREKNEASDPRGILKSPGKIKEVISLFKKKHLNKNFYHRLVLEKTKLLL